MNNYLKYRGKCKELAEKLAAEKGYRVVRGFYNEPLWNTKESHWWCVDEAGNIIDPSAKQFPSGGLHFCYEEFDGFVNCEECGKRISEADIIMQGRFPVCSNKCALALVGLSEYYKEH